jgi:hypothetical protein
MSGLMESVHAINRKASKQKQRNILPLALQIAMFIRVI